MMFDDPRSNMARQNLLYAAQIKYEAQGKKQSSDLKISMIERIHRAKPGCSACGK
jgi:hypothetical protein